MCSMSSSYQLITYHLILLSSHQLAKPNVHCASMWPMSTVYSSISIMTLSHELMLEPDPCIVAPVSNLQSSVSGYVARKDVTGSTLHRRHFKYEFQEPWEICADCSSISDDYQWQWESKLHHFYDTSSPTEPTMPKIKSSYWCYNHILVMYL